MGDALRVVSHLSGQLAGDAPHLDALLTFVASRLGGKDAEPGYKIDRRNSLPTDVVPIPMLRTPAGRFGVARCTSPILGPVESDRHEYFAKRIGVEHAGLLGDGERKVVTTTNSWTKSYRLPLRCRTVQQVAWLCIGNRREILKLLKEVPSIGKKVAHGYGRVDHWECERLGDPAHSFWPWWIDSDAGPVLMRPLPLEWRGLPSNLLGAKQDYGACVDPYWHQDRYAEIVVPC